MTGCRVPLPHDASRSQLRRTALKSVRFFINGMLLYRRCRFASTLFGPRRASILLGVLRMALIYGKNFAVAAGVLLLAGIGAAAWIHNGDNRPVLAPAPVVDLNVQPNEASYAVAPAPGT